MKRLILMRHAHAQSGHMIKVDRDRPLSGEGLKALDITGRLLHQKLFHVDYVLCSNARRTRQTFDAMQKYLPQTVEISFEDRLYGASVHFLIERFRRISDRYTTIFVIGHNPGLQEFLSTTTHYRSPSSLIIKPFEEASVVFFDLVSRAENPSWSESSLQAFQCTEQLLPSSLM